MTSIPELTRRFGAACVVAIALSLTGCGGGGGDAPAVPTALPQTLAVQGPAGMQEVTKPVSFSSNSVDADRKLLYAWSFGDGATSTAAAPAHAYAKPGEYRVTLTLTNESGESRTSASVVRVADLAIVQGKSCSAAEASGWCWQRPLPQGNAINDVFFVDDLRGWAVGEIGTILATTDGGVSWKTHASGTHSSLYKVTFVDAQVGWISGAYGYILRTIDGGATWQSFSIGRSDSVQSLGATNANNAWVTTYSGAYGTTDGGVHWQPLLEASFGSMQLLAVSSVTDLWAVPYYSAQPNVVHSTDGGRTWTSAGIAPPENGLSRYGPRLQFATASVGVFTAGEYGRIGNTYVSRPVAWQTADGGASWQRLSLEGSGASSYSPTVQVVAANAAFVMPNGSSNLRRSTDLGATWQTIVLPQVNGYWSSFRAYSPTRITITDWNGRTYLTTDAGASWADRSAAPASLPSIESVWFFDSREGLALASDGSSIRTADGGQTWTTTAPVAFSYGWQRAQFSASGNVGWVAASSSIYRSTDRGKTWLAPVRETSAQLPYDISDFHFVDETNGWAVTRYWSDDSPLFRSRDGGMSWQPVAKSAILGSAIAIRFADALNGVAVGEAGLAWVTADGGDTWTARPTGVGFALLRLAFVDSTTVVGVGVSGTIVRSTDRGLNWTRVGPPSFYDLNDVRFVTASVGYAAGEAGTLLKTVDGGMTWSAQATSTARNLRSVFFRDEHTGWVAGYGGAILATATGGR